MHIGTAQGSYQVIRVEVSKTGDEKEYPQGGYPSNDDAFSDAAARNNRLRPDSDVFYIVRNPAGEVVYCPQRLR